MKKRLLSIVLALTMVVPVCAMPQAEAYSTGMVDRPNKVAAGSERAGFVKKDGSLWMWGAGSGVFGAEYVNSGIYWVDSPIKILNDVVSVAFTYDCCAALKEDGSLWTWGLKDTLGRDSEVPYYVPTKIMENVAAVAAGEWSFAAIKKDGSLWVWGKNDYGQLGNGTTANCKLPVKIMDDVKTVALGARHSAAIKEDGSLWLWGTNDHDSLENGKSVVPVKIMNDVVSVSLGFSHSAAVKEDGSLWMWGANTYYQIGGGDEFAKGSYPVPIKVMDGVKSVSLGELHSAAIKKDGSLWMWGWDAKGQVGDGEQKNEKYPHAEYPTKIMNDVAEVSLGDDISIAVKEDGSVWYWGIDYKYVWRSPSVLSASVWYDIAHIPVRLGDHVAAVVVPEVPKCTITLNLNGGDGTTKITCDKNGTITPPNNPSRDGYFFAGWYKDKVCTKPWNFDTDKVTGNCTLYAKWEPKSTTTVTAEPSTQKVEIDGKKIILNSYVLRNDQGYPVNFVKLRDIAFLLDGTEANFNVDWRNNAIRLDARQPYTTPNGAEMTVPTVMAAPAKTSITPVLTGGVTAPLEAFLLTDKNGGGHNYFKLRDIGKVAGFNVEWDAERSLIVVTTTEDYIG